MVLYLQAGWKESHATFTSELKNLGATGVTSMGNALKSCFDLLNVNRMQSGIDTYGQVEIKKKEVLFSTPVMTFIHFKKSFFVH